MSASDTPRPKVPHAEVDDPEDIRNLGFQLATLQDFDPVQLLSGDDRVDAFVLAMALAYNDIKSAQWMFYMLQRHPPDDLGGITADLGQWHGMRVQVQRWLMALSHEVVHAVASAKETGILRTPAIRAAVRTLPTTAHQRLWKELVETSTSAKGTGAKIRPYMKKIRDKGVFHFTYSEPLLTAYREYFVSDPKHKFNARAYVSMGNTMAKTRFYFVDAAAQRMYWGTTELEPLFRESDAFIDQLHHTLTGFVWAYLKTRGIRLHVDIAPPPKGGPVKQQTGTIGSDRRSARGRQPAKRP